MQLNNAIDQCSVQGLALLCLRIQFLRDQCNPHALCVKSGDANRATATQYPECQHVNLALL